MIRGKVLTPQVAIKRLYPNLSKVTVAHGAILAVSDAVPRVYGIC